MPNDTGILYVLRNQDRSLAKVGLTRFGSPASRAAGYTEQYGIRWVPFWSAPTQRVAEVEARCHRELASCRFANSPLGSREIFHCTPEHAREVARRHAIAPGALPWRLRMSRKAMGRLLRWAVAIAIGVALVSHGHAQPDFTVNSKNSRPPSEWSCYDFGSGENCHGTDQQGKEWQSRSYDLGGTTYFDATGPDGRHQHCESYTLGSTTYSRCYPDRQ
jgi:hypothetical protein